MSKVLSQLEQKINRDSNQVFLLSCTAHFPFFFARHAYFVINKKGILSRWEVLHRKNLPIGISWKFIYLNAFTVSPFQGIRVFSFSKRFYWMPKLITLIEDSTTEKLIETIETSPEWYPFSNKYVLKGPNSNTYIQSILTKHPELKIKLSERYIGKGFKE